MYKFILVLLTMCSFVFDGVIMDKVVDKVWVCEDGINLTTRCSQPNEISFYGDKIKLGCFVSLDGRIKNECENNIDMQKVSIFALDKIIFDRDIVEKNQLQLIIISPLWEIGSPRNITLDGKDGEDWKVEYGRRDGRPGQHGGNAGSFFGCGQDFLNGYSLVINVNGGNGGPGENGPKGHDGVEGLSATIDNNYYLNYGDCRNFIAPENGSFVLERFRDNRGSISKFRVHYLGEGRGFSPDFLFEGWNRDFRRLEDYEILGYYSEPPDLGGHGGEGGYPGRAGHITLFELGVDSKVIKSKKHGKKGKDGKGGKGGKCAIDGYSTVFRRVCAARGLFWAQNEPYAAHAEHRITKHTVCKDGNDGHDGAIPANKTDLPQTQLERSTILSAITEYKQYIRDNLENDSRKKFLESIETSETIRNLYGTMGFLHELKILESHYYKRSVNDDYSPRYEALLKNIASYSSLQDVRKSPQDLKVLSFLYTAVLGRIYNIKEKSELNIVLDIKAYLDKLADIIKNLRKDEAYSYKNDLIEEYREKYVRYVDSNIKEAESMIDSDILPKLDADMEDLNRNMNQLVKEIKELEKDMKKNLDEIEKKRKQLQKALVLQTLFGAISFFGKVLSMLGGPFLAVGAVVQGVAQVGTLLINKPTFEPVPELQAGIEFTQRRMTDIIDQEKNSLKLKLSEITRLAEKEPKNYRNLLSKIKNINKKLKYVREFSEVQVLRDELEKEVNALKKYELTFKSPFAGLHMTNSEIEIHTEPQVSLKVNKNQSIFSFKNSGVLGKIIDVAKELSKPLLGLKEKYEEGSEELRIVDEQIAKVKNNIRKVQEYENSIKSVWVPAITNMQNDLKNVAFNLGKKSQVELDITLWKVQSLLSNVKTKLKDVTEGFESQENLVNAVASIESCMTVLIKIYDRLQDMQREKKNANYIADINSAASKKVSVINNSLQSAIDYLKVLLQSNLIIQQYDIAVKSFKHQVFPFASWYFKGLVLPSNLESGKNLSDLVDKAERVINHLSTKLTEFRITVSTKKQYTGRGPFGSLFSKKLKPFFLWKNEAHNLMITKLLSGEEVTVLADLEKSDLNLYAVKFKTIDFYLKVKKKSRQKKLDAELDSFLMNVTHLGYSKYRYSKNVYLITSDALLMWRSFSRNKSKLKTPIHIGGGLYDILQSEEYLLSPYTIWKLQIYQEGIFTGGSFETLETFKDEVDVELCGHGYYLLPKVSEVMDLEVEKYYEPEPK